MSEITIDVIIYSLCYVKYKRALEPNVKPCLLPPTWTRSPIRTIAFSFYKLLMAKFKFNLRNKVNHQQILFNLPLTTFYCTEPFPNLWRASWRWRYRLEVLRWPRELWNLWTPQALVPSRWSCGTHPLLPTHVQGQRQSGEAFHRHPLPWQRGRNTCDMEKALFPGWRYRNHVCHQTSLYGRPARYSCGGTREYQGKQNAKLQLNRSSLT